MKKALWAWRTLHVKWLNSRWAQKVQQSFLVEGAVRGLLLKADSHRRMETRNFQICLWGAENCSLQKCIVHWLPCEGKGSYWQVQFACSSRICLRRDVSFCRVPIWAGKTPSHEAVSSILVTKAHTSEIVLWPCVHAYISALAQNLQRWLN